MCKKTLYRFSPMVLAVILFLNFIPLKAFAAHPEHTGESVVSLNDVIVPMGETVEHVVVIGGNAVVAGTVTHEVIVINGNLTLQKTAQLKRFAVVIGGEIIRQEGSWVNNGVINISSDLNNLISISLAVIMVLLLESFKLALSGAIIILIPILAWSLSFIGKSAKLPVLCEKNFLKNITLGILVCVAFQLAGTLLTISIIGIPMLILLITLFTAIALWGLSGLCTAVGTKIAAQINKSGQGILLESLCGAITLALFVNIPFIGFFILTLALLYGIGAVVVFFKKL